MTIVVPAYNPGRSFGRFLRHLREALLESGLTFEVIVVADGCTDGSDEEAASVDPMRIRVIRLPRNCGKGQALRVGLSHGRGDYLGFIDADGDIDPAAWGLYLDLMRRHQADGILGSKRHPLSQVHYPFIRRLGSWGYQQLVRLLFRFNLRDTQTGMKLFRREVLEEALPLTRECRFTFDVELLAVARRLGYGSFLEAPVAIDYRFGSTISPRAVWEMLRDTLQVFVRLRLLGTYDRAHPNRTPRASVKTQQAVG